MKACAYVVGARTGSGAAIYGLAQQLGFDVILPYRTVIEAERQAHATPLCFFFFAEVADARQLKHTTQAIRFSGGRLRFSPLIYFCAAPSVEAIKQCIGMGFDDVITQPFTQQRVAARVMRQIDTELVYFETVEYFGPDRRREAQGRSADADRRGDGQYRRLEIVRQFSGVDVLRDDLHVVL